MRSTRFRAVLVVMAAALSLRGANPPKVLVIYDMEGISGVVAPSYERYQTREYPQGRESLTADVNASIRGPQSRRRWRDMG
jgi:hypothetical protein